jgi:hypothetical protein
MKTMNNLPQDFPTREDIEQLKRNWCGDPHWDIEDTAGFECHYIELKAFRIGWELNWKQTQDSLVSNKAKALNCSPELASYILKLEDEIHEFRLFMAEFGY